MNAARTLKRMEHIYHGLWALLYCDILLSVILYYYLGGSAFRGKIKGSGYFLGRNLEPQFTEVSREVWQVSYYQTYSIYVCFGLLIAMFVLMTILHFFRGKRK